MNLISFLLSSLSVQASKGPQPASPGASLAFGILFAALGTAGLRLRKQLWARLPERKQRPFQPMVSRLLYLFSFVTVPAIFVAAGVAIFIDGLLRI
jgi:hypothetical protein